MKVYYFNGTHWDREWYLPFQSFRYELVDMINQLIDTLETNPDYKIFCMDGQTVVLEDYAEMEPKNAKRLQKLIEEGRIVVGPWFVMPDEYLVSGESLIRNLMTGHRLAKKWGGKPLKYGYINDIFGHIAQLPQILEGFDIHGAFISRGISDQNYNPFLWTAPNGSECYTSAQCYSYFKLRVMKHFGTEDYEKYFREYMDLNIKRSQVPVVLISNTWDHSQANPNDPQMLEKVSELYPEAEVCDVTLDEMATELSKYRDELPKMDGELSLPMKGANGIADILDLLYHCLSAYYPIKYQNDECQNLLEKRMEPLMVVCEEEGRGFNRRYMEKAYHYLLLNHAHDSICGCSVDQVHKDMVYRFDQTKEICDCLFEEYLKQERDIQWSPELRAKYVVKVFNTLPIARKRYYTADVWFYQDFPKKHKGYAEEEELNDFKLYDADGNEVAYQLLSVKKNVFKRSIKHAQYSYRQDLYRICFEVEVPAMGYAEFTVLPSDEKVRYAQDKATGLCTAIPNDTTLMWGRNWAQNNCVRMEIAGNGELTLQDLKTGKSYRDLNGFVDDGDIGDGWNFQSLVNDETLYSDGISANVSLVRAGIGEVVFRVEKKWELPAEYDEWTRARSTEKAMLVLQYLVTLQKNSPAVVVELDLENTMKNHRLRMLLPTGVAGNTYFAGQSFYLVERKTGINPETLGWREPEHLERNMNGIVGKRGEDGCGLAFVSARGLHEAGCDNDEDSTIAVTLYRSFDKVVATDKGVGPLLYGTQMKFKYALVPMSGEMGYADLLRVQHDLAEVDMITSGRIETREGARAAKSYLEFSNPNVVLSIFKLAEDQSGYVVRAFNATGEAQKLDMKTGFDYQSAVLANLNEETVKELSEGSHGSPVSLEFAPYEIQTIKFVK